MDRSQFISKNVIDGYVHIVYTWCRQKIKYVKIDPRQLTLKSIKNGQWTDVSL